jgi:hypothetical protein
VLPFCVIFGVVVVDVLLLVQLLISALPFVCLIDGHQQQSNNK